MTRQEAYAQHSFNPPQVVIAGKPRSVPVIVTPSPKAQRITGNGAFTTYTTDNGLPLDAILCSYIDHLGNLWLGTQGAGLCKYDGKSFVTYSTVQGLPDNTILDILEDKSGNLWFGTIGNLTRYDGRAFVNYPPPIETKGMNFSCMTQDAYGNIWLGTEGGGITRYNGKSTTTYTTQQGLVGNNVLSIHVDKRGNIWVGTDGAGVSKYDGKSFVNYTTKNGLAENRILCIEEDKTGAIWFGTFTKGVCKYDGHSFVNYSTGEGLLSVKCISEDREGNLWFCSNGGGVSKFDGKRFVNYNKAQGLSSNYILDMVEDRIGNIWFCTHGSGVCKYDGQAFINYTNEHGLYNDIIWSATEDEKGILWFGTSEGLSSYNGVSFTNYRAPGLNSMIISVMKDTHGNMWLGSLEGGVYCFDGKTYTQYTQEQGLVNNTVGNMLEDSKGNIWFGTDRGISRFDGKTFTNYTMAQGLVSDLVSSCLEDKRGHLWFGTNRGFSYFDGHSFVNYTAAQGFTNDPVFCIQEDETGALWFGTQGGVRYLSPADAASPKTGSPLSFKKITTADGLPDNCIAQLLEMEKGKIIVGTNMGVARFDRPDFKTTGLKGLEIFNSSTGYQIKDVNVGFNCMYKDSKGVLWIGTGAEKTGLVRLEYAAVHHDLAPPIVKIQNIRINEESICWEFLKNRKTRSKNDRLVEYDSLAMLLSELNTFGKTVPQAARDSQYTRFSDVQFDSLTKYHFIPVNLILPYRHNQISFEYAAIEPARPFMVRYQYILEGYDKEWNPVTDKTNVSFGNIDEGTYTFKLKARSPFGIWSTPVSYTFKVLPPWWRTWWMYTLYSILGISLIILITWINSRRLRLKAKELAGEIEKATAIIVKQKKIVEEKNMRITDSIDYAQRIQNAILPERNYISSLFDDYFIYYQPKEIVSGDFYWFAEKDDKVIFALVDCTGHGVPGALMSMIGHSLLNEIINGKGIKESDQILNHLRADVIHVLKQRDTPESQKDGMDIAICVLDKKRKLLEFSGAHHSLYYIRNGTLQDIPGDKQAIGYEKREQQPFTKNILEVMDGDMVYLCTDGFADQKGGTEKKKFFHRRFRQLLESLHKEEMSKQKEILSETFNNWKGSHEQIDDVLVIGIRL
jgi:ligand-binding sensor domain-containing protein/serine phosphatase RsbU (regulator of sigma subunit)